MDTYAFSDSFFYKGNIKKALRFAVFYVKIY